MTKHFAFTLSMPGSPSWNGRWSGEGKLYSRVESARSQKAATALTALVGRHSYRWDDGWCASVDVREVDAAEARKIRSRSDGFCGYDWMIASLKRYGAICDSPPAEAMRGGQ